MNPINANPDKGGLEEQLSACQLEVKKLSENLRLKDEFMGIVSHDLRTPIDVIRGNLDMLITGDAGPISEKVREYLQDAINGAERLMNLVSSILNVARLESGRIKITLENTNLSEVIRSVKTDFDNGIEKAGVHFYFHPADSPLIVYSDKEKLYEVIGNFLGNAMKFTPRGGSITLRLYTKDDYGYLEVKDTGMGMAPEDLKKVFTKFPDIAHDFGYKGTGLGLYISKQLISILGGEIAALSEGLGRGSIFSFCVPLAGTGSAKNLEEKYSSLAKDRQQSAEKQNAQKTASNSKS
ncbi:MAG: HAMP domain-containing sensor histidine kinase [bacterium]|nr:HAMP domain-containing sensor histidine kinase [bacterium]